MTVSAVRSLYPPLVKMRRCYRSVSLRRSEANGEPSVTELRRDLGGDRLALTLRLLLLLTLTRSL